MSRMEEKLSAAGVATVPAATIATIAASVPRDGKVPNNEEPARFPKVSSS